jgi:hypothetical protein
VVVVVGSAVLVPAAAGAERSNARAAPAIAGALLGAQAVDGSGDQLFDALSAEVEHGLKIAPYHPAGNEITERAEG